MRHYAGRIFVSELAVEPIHADILYEHADTGLPRLQETRVGQQIAQLKPQLQCMRPSGDEEAYDALFSDPFALERARRDFNDRAFRGTQWGSAGATGSELARRTNGEGHMVNPPAENGVVRG